jgi:hypothetical protein
MRWPFAQSVTECYIEVTTHSFNVFLRSGGSLMVFSGYHDLSVL